MGIGGAFIMPSTLSIITNVFTDPTERGKAIGVWAGVSALGIGLGPITGGFLLEHFWWGSIFIVNVPIVIIGLVLGFMLIPESSDPSHAALDPVGAVLSIVALGTILWAVIEAPAHGWGAPEILGGFVVGFAVLGVFFVWELRSSHPMLDMHFFENPRFSAASGAITLVFLSLFGTLFLLTQYLQSVLGYSTVEGRRGAVAAGGHADDLRSAVERVGAEVRQQDGRDRRSGARRHVVRVVPDLDAGHRCARGHRRDGADGSRHGQRPRAVHRLDHGLAAAGEGRRRLRGQRHHPPDGWRGRSRGVRLADGEPLPHHDRPRSSARTSRRGCSRR